MNIVTIPKKITQGTELVVIPRERYEEFVRWQKAVKPPRIFKMFKPTPAQLRDLKSARADYKKGNYMTIDELKHRLDIKG